MSWNQSNCEAMVVVCVSTTDVVSTQISVLHTDRRQSECTSRLELQIMMVMMVKMILMIVGGETEVRGHNTWPKLPANFFHSDKLCLAISASISLKRTPTPTLNSDFDSAV